MVRSALGKVAWVGRIASMVFGLALVMALVLGVAGMALGANGDFFKVGRANLASAVSTLDKSGAGPALRLLVDSGAPLAVNSGTKVVNLNADRVDNREASSFANGVGGKATNADKLDGKDSTDFQGKYAQTVVVAKSGGDFTSVQAALDSITDASAGKHYLVWVGPGIYNERVQMKPFVDIEGAGELATRITASGGGGFGAGSSVVSGASDAELRHLTVENTGDSTDAIAIFNASASPRLSNVTATASEGTGINQGIVNFGSSPEMTDVTATASGSNAASDEAAFGVANSGGSSPTMTDVTATASEADYNVGVNNAGSSPTMTDVTATADGGSFARGMENSSSSPKMTNVRLTASGGSTENTGVYNYLHSSPTIRESVISSSGPASHGVWGQFPDDTTSLVTIENSEVKGATGTVKVEGGYKVNIGASKLDGGAVSVSGAGSTVKCAGVHDENYNFSTGPTCP